MPSLCSISLQASSEVHVLQSQDQGDLHARAQLHYDRGQTVSWVKSEGDTLSKGESVIVVESDKADMDVETFYDGFLASIVVVEGETAPVGAPIGLLAETEDGIAEAKAKAAGSSSKTTTPTSEDAAIAPEVAGPSPTVADSKPEIAATTPSDKKGVATPFAKLRSTKLISRKWWVQVRTGG